jgi:hypothetical protein
MMETSSKAALALALCASLFAGRAGAETEAQPTPPPAVVAPSVPGISVSPPRSMPDRPPSGEKAQPQSCPGTGERLELIV